jgi:hypothetical protein
MKTVFAPIIIALGLINSNSFAASHVTDTAQVPQAITDNYHKLFPANTNTVWQNINDEYKATCNVNDTEWVVTYNKNGHCIEVDKKIPYESLPTVFKNQIEKEFQTDYHIVNVIVVDQLGDRPNYEVRIKQGKLVYTMEFADTDKSDLAFHKMLKS